jgi:hypothetical protein
LAPFFTRTPAPRLLKPGKSFDLKNAHVAISRLRGVGEQIALSHAAVSKRLVGAPRENKSSTSATRWLAIALIVWLAGAVAGFAMRPKHATWSERSRKPPAHRPVDIESPSTHYLPALA